MVSDWVIRNEVRMNWVLQDSDWRLSAISMVRVVPHRRLGSNTGFILRHKNSSVLTIGIPYSSSNWWRRYRVVHEARINLRWGSHHHMGILVRDFIRRSRIGLVAHNLGTRLDTLMNGGHFMGKTSMD